MTEHADWCASHVRNVTPSHAHTMLVCAKSHLDIMLISLTFPNSLIGTVGIVLLDALTQNSGASDYECGLRRRQRRAVLQMMLQCCWTTNHTSKTILKNISVRSQPQVNKCVAFVRDDHICPKLIGGSAKSAEPRRPISSFSITFCVNFHVFFFVLVMASPDFQAALTTMGFNAATCGYCTLNGVNSSTELIRMLPKELTTCVASSARTGAPMRGAAIEDGILFPIISLKSLRAHRAWSLYRSVCRLPLTEDAFTDPLCLQWVDQGDMLAGETEFDTDTLEKLVSFDNWPTWEELLLSALRQMRNIRTGFSLEHLTRVISEVPAPARAATYDCIDDQTCALALHYGPSYMWQPQSASLLLLSRCSSGARPTMCLSLSALVTRNSGIVTFWEVQGPPIPTNCYTFCPIPAGRYSLQIDAIPP
jgi:hypothetical protein